MCRHNAQVECTRVQIARPFSVVVVVVVEYPYGYECDNDGETGVLAQAAE